MFGDFVTDGPALQEGRNYGEAGLSHAWRGCAPGTRSGASLLGPPRRPAVRRLAKIIKHGENAQALAAIKVVLERNELYAFGVDRPACGASPPSVTVQAQVNLPEARVAEMSDSDLKAYDRLLTELKELCRRMSPSGLAA